MRHALLVLAGLLPAAAYAGQSGHKASDAASLRRGPASNTVASSEHDGGDGQGEAIRLDVWSLRRAGEELAMARRAEQESEVSATALYADQQLLAAQLGAEAAEAAAESDRASVPDTKAALDETRGFAIAAQLHARHAEATLEELQRLPEEAAKAAAAAVRREVRAEAYSAAEAAGRGAPAPAPAPGGRARKVLERVAAAVEPYHLALLRAQKDAAEREAKARGAAAAAAGLAREAERLARAAQALQASGLAAQALQTMAAAHAAAERGVNMRQWAERLHGEAGRLQDSLGAFVAEEEQAAASAAENMGVEVTATLPTRPPAAW